MTTQDSKKNRLIDNYKYHCPEVKVDNLVINLLLANLTGQFKLVIVQLHLQNLHGHRHRPKLTKTLLYTPPSPPPSPLQDKDPG